MINYGTLCTQYLDAYWDVGWQWVFYSWVAAVILVTWYFTITFRTLILLLILKILDGVVGGGGGSSWVAAVILVTERESSLLCPPRPSPARGRPQATYVPKCRQFNKKTFGRSEGSRMCGCLCCSEGVELIVLKVLDEVIGGGWLVILRSTQFNWHQPPKHLIVKASRWWS